MNVFEKYVNMIRKKAHGVSQKYKVPYDEMESQGFLIYCECLKRYDVSKANFGTFLYIQLNRLADFAKTYRRQQGVLIQDYYASANETSDYESKIPAQEINPTFQQLLEEAKSNLSHGAYNLLLWIVSREWERKNKRTPTVSMAVKYFNSKKEIIESLWKEIGVFWNGAGIAFYA